MLLGFHVGHNTLGSGKNEVAKAASECSDIAGLLVKAAGWLGQALDSVNTRLAVEIYQTEFDFTLGLGLLDRGKITGLLQGMSDVLCELRRDDRDGGLLGIAAILYAGDEV